MILLEQQSENMRVTLSTPHSAARLPPRRLYMNRELVPATIRLVVSEKGEFRSYDFAMELVRASEGTSHEFYVPDSMEGEEASLVIEGVRGELVHAEVESDYGLFPEPVASNLLAEGTERVPLSRGSAITLGLANPIARVEKMQQQEAEVVPISEAK